MRGLIIAVPLLLGLVGTAGARQASVVTEATPRIGSAQPKAKAPGTIRLATYNFENLFDDRDDPSLSGREEDAKATKPEAHQRALGETLRRLDADIVACQEIESFDALIEFREKHAKGLGYRFVQSIDVGAERGIEQAVLSRFPIVHAEVWPVMDLDGVQPATIDGKPNEQVGKALESRRSPLVVTVRVPALEQGGKAYELTLVVVHHKSGRAFDFWREAEARTFAGTVREMQRAEPGRNIAVLGDFNSTAEQAPLRVYSETGLSSVLSGHGDTDAGYISHASGRRIDHILVNEALKHEVVLGSEFVLATPQLRPEEDWRTAPKPAGYASDHLPVVVDLRPVDE